MRVLKIFNPENVMLFPSSPRETGADAKLSTLRHGNIVGKSTAKRLLINKSVPDFDLETIFRDLAMLGYDCAIELAKGFQAEGPRAIATIAIARAILHPKKEASQKR